MMLYSAISIGWAVVKLIPLISFIGCIGFMIERRNLLSPSDAGFPLSTVERSLTWYFCLVNPITAGAILYYGWRHRLPVRANQANRISYLAAVIELIAVVTLLL